MADNTTNGKRQAKLPPLDALAENLDENKPKKKVVRKKKKAADEVTGETVSEKPKATPRKKKAASADSAAISGDEVPKKKKRTPRKKDVHEEDPASARSGTGQAEDVDGSKSSLIKSPKEGTPRKKRVKKKVKKTDDQAAGVDNFFDSTLAADLTDIKDDIVSADAKKDEEEEEHIKQPYSTASVQLRSQPTEKFYIETVGGFKHENKNRFVKRQAEEAKDKAVVHKVPTNTTIEFALSTHKVLRIFVLFCHGVLAGLAIWHIVMSYILLKFGDTDFIKHYRGLALPVQCIFYILIVLCSVSAMDRFDIGMLRRGFVLKALTLQNGTLSVVLYITALIISLSNGALEDKIHLYNLKPELWNSTVTTSEDLTVWRNLNTTRNVLCVLGWFVISLTPLYDRLSENLQHADEEELLGVHVTGNEKASLA